MTRVKRSIAGVVFTLSALGGVLVTGGAAHAVPAERTDTNCHGYVLSRAAQSQGGIGKFPKNVGISVKDFQTAIRAGC